LSTLQAKNESKVSLSIARSGFEFNYNARSWQLNRNYKINVQFLSKFDVGLKEDIRETLVYFAEMYSAAYVSSYVDNLRFYLKQTDASTFSVDALVLLKNKISKNQQPKIASLRTFIRQMRYLGLNSNFDNDVYELSDRWKLYGGDRGVPVLSLDPETGPFSAFEFQAIGTAAAHCFAERRLTIKEYSCILLFKATGRRPEQIATLKIKDFSFSNAYIGTKTYVVKIPRIKQSGGGFRKAFKDFGLVKSVGQIIDQYIIYLITRIEKNVGRKLSNAEKRELPLYPDKELGINLRGLDAKKTLLFLTSELSHIKSSNLSRYHSASMDKLKVVSERTGQLIHTNPYRFRYTLGTRAAIQGAGKATIATLLDHSDEQHTDVYVANVPEYAIEISKIMNQPLAKYASAFAGKVVASEEVANIENPGAARIPLHEKNCDIGSCGTNAFCQDNAPIACYICPKFRPWQDAPHHLVLEWLMEERERLKKTLKGDMEIVSINDNIIMAVCQVIDLCKETKDV